MGLPSTADAHSILRCHLSIEPESLQVSDANAESLENALDALTGDGPLAYAVRRPDGQGCCVLAAQPDVSGQAAWVSFRVLDPVPLGASLEGLCGIARAAGADVLMHALPAGLVATLAPPHLVCRQEAVGQVTAALVRGGCLVTPALAICPRPPPAEEVPPVPEDYVGAWKRRGSIPEVIRLQAASGHFVDISLPDPIGPGSGGTPQACCGILALDAQGAKRYCLVDFAPPSGPPRSRPTTLSPQGNVLRVAPSADGGAEADEEWQRLDLGRGMEGSGKLAFLALELISEEPARPVQRAGIWLFCGNTFARCIGPRIGEGLVARSCCKDLEHLRLIKGDVVVDRELRSNYDAVLGTVDHPGALRLIRRSWVTVAPETFFYHAEKSVGGEITLTAGVVEHRLPDGLVQRWKAQDMPFNPFGEKPKRQEAFDPYKVNGVEGKAAQNGDVKEEIKEKDTKKRDTSSDSDSSRSADKKKDKHRDKRKDKSSSSSESEHKKDKDRDRRKRSRSHSRDKKRKSRSRSAKKKSKEKIGRSTKRSKSRDRKRSKSREKKRSRSRSKHKKKDKDRSRSRSRSRHKKKSRSRSRDRKKERSRSRDKKRGRDSAISRSRERASPKAGTRGRRGGFDVNTPQPGTVAAAVATALNPSAALSSSASPEQILSLARMVGVPSPFGPRAELNEVEQFLLLNPVDPEAATRLRSLPPHLQRIVLDRGPLMGTRNPSSVLIVRIRDAETGRSLGGHGLGVPAPPPNFMTNPRLERMIMQYNLDARAAGLLRSLPPEQQRAAAELPLHEARNPSAFVMAQLTLPSRATQAQQHSGYMPGRQPALSMITSRPDIL